jgi:hypothetical protein
LARWIRFQEAALSEQQSLKDKGGWLESNGRRFRGGRAVEIDPMDQFIDDNAASDSTGSASA